METKLFARQCSCCGNGMNHGYVVNGGEEYYCSDKCLESNYTHEEWEEMSMEDDDSLFSVDNYWTEWEDEDDYEYQLINGKLIEIEQL